MFCGSRPPRDWSTYASCDRVADPELAAVGLLLAGDHLEEGRLAGAVRPDHADDAAGRERERHVLDEQPVAEALGDVLGLDDEVAEPRAGRDVDLDALDLEVRVVGEHLLVGRHARLRLRLPRARAHAHPLELAGERAPARRLGLLLDREPRLLLLEPRRVVALERQPLAAVELEDPAGDVVEEVAIVGDRHHGALVVLEEALQPGDRLGVEVVRRLVEEQQVGGGEEQPAERDPAALAAGERGHVAVALGQAQRVHGAVELGVEAPRVVAVDLLLHLGLLGEQRVEVGVGLGEGCRDGVEAVEQVAQLADAVLDVAAHVLGRVELGLLLEEADGGAGMQLGDAGRGLLEPRHDPHQRRLAGPVRAEHADLRPRQERQGDVRQHLPVGAVELVDPVHRVDVVAAHRPARLPPGEKGRAATPDSPYTATAARSSSSRNARDHSARSPQPRHETMFPSTTAGAVDVLAAGHLDVGRERAEAGAATAAQEAERRRHLGAVAERADRLLLGEEVLDDPRHVGIDPDELRRAAAGDDERRVVGGSTSANVTSTGHVRPGRST